MKKYFVTAIASLLVFLVIPSASFASTLYFNDFTSQTDGWWFDQHSYNILTTSSGLQAITGTNGFYQTNFSNLKCASADVSITSNSAAGVYLSNTPEGDGLEIATVGYGNGSHISIQDAYNVNQDENVYDTGYPTPNTKFNLGFCQSSTTWTVYVNNSLIYSMANQETGNSYPFGGLLIDRTGDTITNFLLSSSIPTTSTLVTAINAGGDVQGNFVADTDYSGGSQYSSTNSVDTSAVTNPAPEAVYKTVRYGNTTYTIPNLTANTNYTVRLHFNELYWNSAGSRVFNVSLNGNQVLHNFDIFNTAGGEKKAIVEQFNATSDSNGEIAIALSNVTDNAMVNGIEIDSTTVPTHSLSGTVYNDTNRNGVQDSGETGASGATVTLSSGQTTTTDTNGNYTFSNLPQEDTYTATVTLPNGYVATTSNPARFSLNTDTTENFGMATFQSLSINAGGSSSSSFLADLDYSGGQTYSTSTSVDTSGVTNPAPQSVYQTVRYGNFSYTVPNLVSSHTYTVRLHFNELYWTSAGSRVFNVSINGSQVLSNFDIYQAAGGANKADVEQFTSTPDSNGNLTITFTTVTDNAMVNGIEVSQ